MKKYTNSAKNTDNPDKWLVVDAQDMVLGRLASAVASRLRGKHNPMFTPHADTGDSVIVINADKIVLTCRKLDQKTYYRHSGYMGGLKSITAKKLIEKKPKELVRFAVKLEKHYRIPQDIEWAIDKKGTLYLLQSRPLQVIKTSKAKNDIDSSQFKAITSGGTTVCPGAGCGPVYHVSSFRDLPDVPDGAVLVTHHPFPGLITVPSPI